MPLFEYRVVPAPKSGVKAKGLRTGEDRFANALQTVMNDMGRKGWEYLRTDTLPSEERSGLTRKTTVFQNVLVFRRELPEGTVPEAEPKAEKPVLTTTPAPSTAVAPKITANGETAA